MGELNFQTDHKPLREIIQEALAEYGGETVAGVAIYHIENTIGFNVGEALEKPKEFISALDQIFDGYTPIITSKICQKIAKEYGIEYNGENFLKFAKKLKASGLQIV